MSFLQKRGTVVLNLGLGLGLTSSLGGLAMAAPADVSMETVRSVASELTTAAMDGRAPGSEGHTLAKNYLVAWLQTHGVQPLGASAGSYLQEFDRGTNIIGLVPGSDPNDRQPRALISAHYDHLGRSCRHHPLSIGPVCNGAADDAGGVAVVLAAAEALSQQLSSPVAIALWDAEEAGLLGSKFFTTAPTFTASGLRLAIDMDIVGLNTFRGFETAHYAIGAETGGQGLIDDLQASTPKALAVSQLSYAFGHNRSDLTSFVAAGWNVPFVLFSDGDGSVYHSDADDFEHLNLAKVRDVATTVTGLALRSDRAPAPYEYVAPFHVEQTYLPLFRDAAAIEATLVRLGAVSDANELSVETRQQLATRLEGIRAIIAAGPTRFGQNAMVELATAARWSVSVSRGLPFIP